MIASKGAASGQPRVPSPPRSSMFVYPSFSNRARAGAINDFLPLDRVDPARDPTLRAAA